MNVLSFPILLTIDESLVPGPLLLAHLALVLLMSASEMSRYNRRVLGWAVVGAIPGAVAGAWLITVLSQGQLTGLALVALTGVIVAVLGGARLHQSRLALTGIGIVSGVMGTTVSVNGPPLALALTDEPGPARRGTLAVFLTIGTAISITALIVVGRFGGSALASGLRLIPATVAGQLVAVRMRHRIDRIDPRLVVIPLAAISGAIGLRTILP